MHGDDKTYLMKPTKICEMHGDDKTFPLKPSKFVKCMETRKRFHSNQL